MSTENSQATESAASLTISDLILTLNFIQVVTQRGAIKAEEMSSIGSLYDRLYKFLDAQGAFNKPSETAEEATEEATA